VQTGDLQFTTLC